MIFQICMSIECIYFTTIKFTPIRHQTLLFRRRTKLKNVLCSMSSAAKNYFTPTIQNDLENLKHTDHTKIYPGHNILKFILLPLLLMLYCMTQMLNKSNERIYKSFVSMEVFLVIIFAHFQ